MTIMRLSLAAGAETGAGGGGGDMCFGMVLALEMRTGPFLSFVDSGFVRMETVPGDIRGVLIELEAPVGVNSISPWLRLISEGQMGRRVARWMLSGVPRVH